MKNFKNIVIVLFLVLPFLGMGQQGCKFSLDTTSILLNKTLDNFLLKLQSDSFITFNDKKAIPGFVKNQLNCLSGDFSIANPDQQYQAGCVVIKKLPGRKLLYLAKSNDMLIMTYLTGGWGVSTHILFIKFTCNKIIDLWTGVCLKDLKSKTDILTYIKEHRNKEWGLNSNLVYL